jgi:hypothetical protein
VTTPRDPHVGLDALRSDGTERDRQGEVDASRTEARDSLDLLIGVRRQSAERWAGRLDGMETRATGIATAAVTLGVVVVSQHAALAGASGRAGAALALLMVTVLLSLVGRAWPRTRIGSDLRTVRDGVREKAKRARSDSQIAVDQRVRVLQDHAEAIAPGPGALGDALSVRRAVLDYWRARENSNHRAYNAKAAWMGSATLPFVAALVLLASVGLELF